MGPLGSGPDPKNGCLCKICFLPGFWDKGIASCIFRKGVAGWGDDQIFELRIFTSKGALQKSKMVLRNFLIRLSPEAQWPCQNFCHFDTKHL